MRLIDAEEVHEIFNWSHQKPPYSKKTIHRYIDMAREVDAVPVIRCKDCKHMVEHKGYGYLGESAYTCESNMDGWILPDSYCSMAERKEE